MKALPLLGVFVAVTLACRSSSFAPEEAGGAGAGLKTFQTQQNVTIPFDLVQFVPCANGGAGELVQLSGPLHLIFHLVISSSGNLSAKSHVQPEGISGLGLTTGEKYQGTGATQDFTHTGVVGEAFTATNNFRIIGQGTGNNLLVHEDIHFTVNANGTVTADHDHVSLECS